MKLSEGINAAMEAEELSENRTEEDLEELRRELNKELPGEPIEEPAEEPIEEPIKEPLCIPAADGLKFWLMPFVCILCFGFPTRFGGNIAALSGFAPLCFFILCGFFALTEDEREQKKLKKRIIRAAITFLITLVLYGGVNIGYYLLTGTNAKALFAALFSRRSLFNFLVLCAWPFPMGQSIWFIQSLLYAYLILYVMNLLKLQRFRGILLIVCVILMLLTGELAVVCRLSFFGAPYLPPNALTRALPYLLLGWLLRKNMDALRERKAWHYLLMVPLGLILAFGEFVLLARMGCLATTSHAIGLGLTAFGLCAWTLFFGPAEPGFFCLAGRSFARIIYVSCQLVAFLLIVPMSMVSPVIAGFVQYLGGLIVYPICFVLALVMDMAQE